MSGRLERCRVRRPGFRQLPRVWYPRAGPLVYLHTLAPGVKPGKSRQIAATMKEDPRPPYPARPRDGWHFSGDGVRFSTETTAATLRPSTADFPAPPSSPAP